eukprot:c18481_g1_i1 orf=854-1957(+)
MENRCRFRQKVSNMSAEDKELYNKAREATQKAEREGDAQLKAAIAAVSGVKFNPIRLNPIDLRFTNSSLEQAYWRKSSTDSDYRDAVPFACQLAFSIMFILQVVREQNLVSTKWKETVFLHLPTFLNELVLCIWIAAICVGVLVLQLGFSSWFRSNRGTVLLCTSLFLWVEEGVRLFVLSCESMSELIFVLIQSTLMSALHQVPFCMHLRMRALGFLMQMFAALARRRMRGDTLYLFFVCIGHCFGVILAYILDRKSRSKFLRSFPGWKLDDETFKDGSRPQFLWYRTSFSRQMWKIFCPELPGEISDSNTCADMKHSLPSTPRRALGGFAGGFGGVSSLKGTYPLMPQGSSSCDRFSVEDQMSRHS